MPNSRSSTSGEEIRDEGSPPNVMSFMAALPRLCRRLAREQYRQLMDLAVHRGYVAAAQIENMILEDDEPRSPGGPLVARGLISAAQFDELCRLLFGTEACAVGTSPGAPQPGLFFGPYEVLGKLGEGAMSVVYRARDSKLGRVVALKVLREGGDCTPQLVERFHREAALTARLRHPNIVAVHDVGETSGASASGTVRYIAMDYIPGTTLADTLPSWRGRWPDIAVLLEKIARAVHFAHEKGVIHRDLKPQNVLIDDRGEPLIADFGLAKEIEAAPGLTRSGSVVGTPYYMSPEQVRGHAKRVERRSDVYALGVILHQLLAGRPPYTGTSVNEVYNKILSEDPPPITGVPRDLAIIASKAMQKEPARRYPSAAQMADDLRRWLDGEPILAKPPSVLASVVRKVRRHPVLAALALATPAILATGMLVSRHQIEAARRAAVLSSVEPQLSAVETLVAKLPPPPSVESLQRPADERPHEREDRLRVINVLVEADGRLRRCAESLSAVPDSGEWLARLRRRQYDVNHGLLLWALRGGDCTLARIAAAACETLDHARHGAQRLADIIGRVEQASARQQAENLRGALADIAAGLYRKGRDPGAPILEDYVLKCTAYSDEQAVAILSEALAPMAEKARLEGAGALWMQEEKDLMVFCFRVLGSLDRESAVPPLSRMLDALRDTRLLIECGQALCTTRRESAHAPVIALRDRLGSGSPEWRQVSRLFARIPLPQKEPRTSQDFVERGLFRRDKGDLAGALTDFTRAIEVGADNASAYASRGTAKWELYNALLDARILEEALEDLSRAVRLNPGNPGTLTYRGLARMDKDDYDGAIADFTRAIELNARHIMAWRSRAIARRRSGDLEGSLSDFDSALAIDPKDVNALAGRGLTRKQRGDLAGAIADVSRAIEIDPSGPNAFWNRGNFYAEKGDWEAAVWDFDRALAVDPQYYSAFRDRGRARRARGDAAGAILDWKKYLELAPDDRRVRGWIEEAEADLKKGSLRRP